MDQNAIADLKSDDRLKLKALYNKYRDAFLGFGKSSSLDADTLADIYQEAFLALRHKARNGKLLTVNCSMKTYLFGIGRHMISDALKKNWGRVSYEPNLHLAEEDPEEFEFEIEDTPALNANQRKLRRCFKKLGEKCRLLLTLFYYRGLSIKEIVLKAGYDNENVVKSSKSRCLKSLKEMIKS